jgi:hypothetical protein
MGDHRTVNGEARAGTDRPGSDILPDATRSVRRGALIVEHPMRDPRAWRGGSATDRSSGSVETFFAPIMKLLQMPTNME